MSEYNPYKPEYEENIVKAPVDKTPVQDVPARYIDKLVSIIYSSVLLGVQVLTIIFLLCGCVRFNNSGVNLVSACTLIINVFLMTLGTVYKSLMGGAAGVAFFVFVVFAIIRLVRSIKIFIVVIKRRKSATTECRINYNLIDTLYNYCITTVVNVLVFAVASNLLGTSELSGMLIALMVIVGIVFVGRGIIRYIYTGAQFGIIDFISDTVKNIVMYVTLMLTVVFLNSAAGKDFMYGAQKMFNGNVFGGSFASTMYSLYVNILEPALFVVIAIIMLTIITGTLRCTFFLEKERRTRITAALTITAVTMVLHLIFRVFVASGATSFKISLIGYWLSLISSTYIPLLLFAIVMLIVSISFSVKVEDSKPVAVVPESFKQQA